MRTSTLAPTAATTRSSVGQLDSSARPTLNRADRSRADTPRSRSTSSAWREARPDPQRSHRDARSEPNPRRQRWRPAIALPVIAASTIAQPWITPKGPSPPRSSTCSTTPSAGMRDRPALGLWHDDGTTTTWTYRELDRRSRLAAWRLRERPRPPARRSDPDLEPVRARPAGRLLRGDAGRPDPRPARPPDEPRRDPGHRRPRGAAPPDPRHRPRRARTRPPRASPTSRRRPSPTSSRIRTPGDGTRRRNAWSKQSTRWPRPRPRGRLGPDLHLGHDRHAEGRDGRPRQPARDDGRDQPRHPAARPPRRQRPAAQPPVRAGDRADLRAERRRRHPLRPEPQPAGPLRGAPGPPGDEHDRRPAGARPVLERDRARGRPIRPAGAVRPPPRRSPATCPTRPGA